MSLGTDGLSAAGLRTLMNRPGPTAPGVAEGDILLVTIGAGARVLGPVYIGDHVQIGADSVVVKDIPAGAVATGIPATIRFPNKGEDPYEAMFKDHALWI